MECWLYLCRNDIWKVFFIIILLNKFVNSLFYRPLFASKRKGDRWQLEEILRILGTPPKEAWPSDVPIVVEQFKVYPSYSLSHHISALSTFTTEEKLLSVCLLLDTVTKYYYRILFS